MTNDVSYWGCMCVTRLCPTTLVMGGSATKHIDYGGQRPMTLLIGGPATNDIGNWGSSDIGNWGVQRQITLTIGVSDQ